MSHLHNTVQLIGRAGAAVDLLRLTDGTFRGTLRLYQDPRGTASAAGNSTAQVHTLVAWNATARRFHERVHRGDTLLIQGHLHNRKFTLEGQTHVRTEVHVDQFTVLTRRAATSPPRSLGIRAQPALAAEPTQTTYQIQP